MILLTKATDRTPGGAEHLPTEALDVHPHRQGPGGRDGEAGPAGGGFGGRGKAALLAEEGAHKRAAPHAQKVQKGLVSDLRERVQRHPRHVREGTVEHRRDLVGGEPPRLPARGT